MKNEVTLHKEKLVYFEGLRVSFRGRCKMKRDGRRPTKAAFKSCDMLRYITSLELGGIPANVPLVSCRTHAAPHRSYQLQFVQKAASTGTALQCLGSLRARWNPWGPSDKDPMQS